MNLTEFKDSLFSGLSEKLKLDGFKLIKSQELFISKNNSEINKIFIYVISYQDFFSIKIQPYFDSEYIDRKLKENYSGYDRLVKKGIIGGDCKKIAKIIFEDEWVLPSSNIIHSKEKSLNELTDTIIFLYEKYINPFFNLCKQSSFVHKVLNEYNIKNVGLGVNYQNRVLKGLLVAENAGIPQKDLKILAEKYQKELERENLYYLEDFIELKSNLHIQ